jgi:hypothetical protein
MKSVKLVSLLLAVMILFIALSAFITEQQTVIESQKIYLPVIKGIYFGMKDTEVKRVLGEPYKYTEEHSKIVRGYGDVQYQEEYTYKQTVMSYEGEVSFYFDEGYLENMIIRFSDLTSKASDKLCGEFSDLSEDWFEENYGDYYDTYWDDTVSSYSMSFDDDSKIEFEISGDYELTDCLLFDCGYACETDILSNISKLYQNSRVPDVDSIYKSLLNTTDKYSTDKALDYKIEEDTSTLYVMGNGEMKFDGETAPWMDDNLYYKGIENIVVCKGLTSIADHAFDDDVEGSTGDGVNGYYDLKNVIIADTVESIGDSAFENCNKLKNVKIPDSVTKIGKNVFLSCDRLKNITLPKNLEKIPANAFSECYKLKNVTISDGVKVIGANAFCGVGIKELKLPNSIEKIGAEAFDYSDLKSINLPNSIEEIGAEAFNCSELKSINLPDSIKKIGSEAFYQTKIKEIVLPKGLKKINAYTFARCRKLKNVVIPDNIEYIGKSAFFNCKKLKTVEIPKSVKTIKKYALGYYSDYSDYYYECDYDDAHKKVKGFTIKGYKGTEAETYAKENGFKFIALD